MPKIFPHRPRKVRPVQPRPIVALEDSEKRRARVAADRRRRMLERSAARTIHSTALKDQSDRDADWLAAHPGRDHRVRRKTEGEFPAHIDSDHWKWVVVRQVEPGMRLRLTFNVPHGRRKFLECAATEEGAKTVFEMVASDPNAKAVDTWPGAATS
jgi:hypothetical protein